MRAQRVNQRRGDARAGAADRMPEGDRAAVNVELRAIEAQVALARQHLRGERFVQLDEVDVVESDAGVV